MGSIKLTTTGTQDPVVVAGRVFTHPTSDFELLDEFTFQELAGSDTLDQAIADGYITLEVNGSSSSGVSIADAEEIEGKDYFKTYVPSSNSSTGWVEKAELDETFRGGNYAINAEWLWGVNNFATTLVVDITIDGTTQKSVSIPAAKAGVYGLPGKVYYEINISAGQHTVGFKFKSSKSNKLATVSNLLFIVEEL
jgi:hypothetical protein